MTTRVWAIWVAAVTSALALSACDGCTPLIDDAGVIDDDGGVVGDADAGRDAGVVTDAGPAVDAGPVDVDGGGNDAGDEVFDAGSPDAGADLDAGEDPDSGAVDADAANEDAGTVVTVVDSGDPDAGRDDAGFDAGPFVDVDAGTDDAGTDDAGELDAGEDDGGFVDDGGIADGGVEDGGVEDGGMDDAGSDDAGVQDAGVQDAGPPPLRTVRQVNVFADMPLHNLVFDPQFTTQNWFVITGDLSAYHSWQRRVPLASPGRQPAMVLPAHVDGVYASGPVKAVPRPMRAVVWLGRAEGADDENFAQVSVRLAGFFDDVGSAEVNLVRDVSVDTERRGGIAWSKFVADVPAARGWFDLQIVEDANRGLYVCAPEVTDDAAPLVEMQTQVPTPPTPLSFSAEEGLALRAVLQQDQLRVPQVPGRILLP